jgi:hypothetical protein
VYSDPGLKARWQSTLESTFDPSKLLSSTVPVPLPSPQMTETAQHQPPRPVMHLSTPLSIGCEALGTSPASQQSILPPQNIHKTPSHADTGQEQRNFTAMSSETSNQETEANHEVCGPSTPPPDGPASLRTASLVTDDQSLIHSTLDGMSDRSTRASQQDIDMDINMGIDMGIDMNTDTYLLTHCGDQDNPVDLEKLQLTTVANARDTMIGILEDPSKWLTGMIISHFLELARATRPCWLTATWSIPLPFDSAQPIHDTVRDPEGEMLLCIHRDQSHWLTARVSLAAKTVRAYDSGGFSNAATILQELRHHIQDVHLFRASDEECPSQRDSSSCGVYALTFVLYLVADIQLPSQLTVSLWRKVLLCMVKQQSLTSFFPSYVTTLEQSDAFPEEPVLTHMPDNPRSTPMTKALHHSREIAQRILWIREVADSGRKYYASRVEDLANIRGWVEGELTPVILGLTAQTSKTITRLTGKMADIAHDRTIMEGMVENSFKLTKQSEDINRCCHSMLEANKFAGRGVQRDLDKAMDAVKGYAVLDLESFRREINAAEKGYQVELAKAEEALAALAAAP